MESKGRSMANRNKANITERNIALKPRNQVIRNLNKAPKIMVKGRDDPPLQLPSVGRIAKPKISSTKKTNKSTISADRLIENEITKIPNLKPDELQIVSIYISLYHKYITTQEKLNQEKSRYQTKYTSYQGKYRSYLDLLGEKESLLSQQQMLLDQVPIIDELHSLQSDLLKINNIELYLRETINLDTINRKTSIQNCLLSVGSRLSYIDQLLNTFDSIENNLSDKNTKNQENDGDNNNNNNNNNDTNIQIDDNKNDDDNDSPLNDVKDSQNDDTKQKDETKHKDVIDDQDTDNSGNANDSENETRDSTSNIDIDDGSDIDDSK